MNSGTDQRPAGDGQDSAEELAALRRRYSDWEIRRGAGSDPLGYSASRPGCLLTAPSLARLADRLAGADDAPGMLP